MAKNPIVKYVGDTHELILDNHGSSGMSIQWEIKEDQIATVQRLENIPPENPTPGAPIQTVYKIEFQKKGKVNIHFFESQIWDPGAPRKTISKISFTVK